MQRDLEAIVGNRNRRIHEMTLAIGTLVLGVVFGFVDDIYTRSQLFASMRVFLPAEVWGWLFTAMGSIRLTVLIINGVWPLSSHVRWGFSTASMFLVWVPVTASFLTAAVGGFVTAGVALGPIALIGEATCHYSLTALRASRRRAHGQ